MFRSSKHWSPNEKRPVILFYFRLKKLKKDLYTPRLFPGLMKNWRTLYTWVSLCLTFLKRSVCGSANEVPEMACFPERADYLCGVFCLLFAQFPRRGCFLSMISVRHEDVFVERCAGSQASGSPEWDTESKNIPKTRFTNWDKLCLDPVQGEFYCFSKHQRDWSSLPPSLRNICSASSLFREKGRLKCFYVHLFVLIVSIGLEVQKKHN